jgi:hypothetical protein
MIASSWLTSDLAGYPSWATSLNLADCASDSSLCIPTKSGHLERQKLENENENRRWRGEIRLTPSQNVWFTTDWTHTMIQIKNDTSNNVQNKTNKNGENGAHNFFSMRVILFCRENTSMTSKCRCYVNNQVQAAGRPGRSMILWNWKIIVSKETLSWSQARVQRVRRMLAVFRLSTDLTYYSDWIISFVSKL